MSQNIIRKAIKITLIILGLFIILITALLLYIEYNKTDIINYVEEAYHDKTGGQLKIENFELYPLRHFPAIGLVVENISTRDSTMMGRNYRRMRAASLEITSPVSALIRQKPIFKSISIKDAIITIYTDTLDTATANANQKKPALPDWLDNKGTYLDLNNIRVHWANTPKKKQVIGTIESITGDLQINNQVINGSLDLNVFMEEMALNVEKGAFFNGVPVRGKLKPRFDVADMDLQVPEFPLQIGEQQFEVAVNINQGTQNNYKFLLTNKATDYKASKGLIAQNIQEKINRYELTEPFYTRTLIEGSFGNGKNPLIQLDYHTINNNVIISKADSVFIQLDSVDFIGQLINRIYDEKMRKSDSKKNFVVNFENGRGQYQGVNFTFSDSYVLTSEEYKNFIQLNMAASGAAERFNEILKTETFIFKEGRFDLTATYRGDPTTPEDLLTLANIKLLMDRPSIYHSEADILFPIRELDFRTKNGTARLNNLDLRFKNNQNIKVTGNLKNYVTLLRPDKNKPVSSVLSIYSKQLDYEELISIFNTPDQGKEEDEEMISRDLRLALENAYLQFDPRLDIAIDKFTYKEYAIENYETQLQFEDKSTIILNESGFDFGEGHISMDGLVRLPADRTTFAKLGIAANGNMASFNEVLGNNTFIFKQGFFELDAGYEGFIETPQQLITGSEVTLRMDHSEVYIPKMDLRLPIDSVEVTIDKRDAILKQLQLPLTSNNVITIDGKLKNFTTLIMEEENFPVTSELGIRSSKLLFKDFAEIQENLQSDSDKPFRPDVIHESLATVYHKFNPRLQLAIDTFARTYYLMKGISTDIYFADSTTVVLENTGFHLNDGKMSLRGNLDFSDRKKINADMALEAKGKAAQFNDLFQNTNFFFREGDFELELRYNGDLLDRSYLIRNINSKLTLDNSKVFYQQMNLTVPLDNVDLTIKDNNAMLKSFHIPLSSGHTVQANGIIENFNTLLLDSIPVDINSRLNFYAEELNFQDLSNMFDVIVPDTPADSLSKKNDSEKNGKKENVFKATISGIQEKFNPTLTVQIDDFWYKTFNVQNVHTGLTFAGKDQLVLKETGFELGDANVMMNAEIDLTDKKATPFNLDFDTDLLEISELVKAFDFFNLPSLKSAEGVSGELATNGILAGRIIDQSGKLDSTLQGEIGFLLKELQLKSFDPITSTAGKVLRDKRLENIRFADLSDTIRVKEGTIQIPRMEITSTAFNLFVEGNLRYDNNSHLWISIPWNNLWFRDYSVIPDDKSFNEAGAKFFIQALGNDENTMDYKFRFTNKKWFKARGLGKQYRRFKKMERKARRNYRREERRKKRSLRKKEQF